jgi:hypothetical protein
MVTIDSITETIDPQFPINTTVGYEFTVNYDVEIIALGISDYNFTTGSRDIMIWEGGLSTGITGTVSSAAASEDNYKYVTLAAPVTLTQGTYKIGALMPSSTPDTVNIYNGTSTITEEFTYISSQVSFGDTLKYPGDLTLVASIPAVCNIKHTSKTIDTTNSVTIDSSGVNDASLNEGGVLFAGTTGTITQDASNLFWDNANNRLGIGTTSPSSKLDVEGNVAIGASYSGTTAAPTNGLLVEGNVGIGTTNPVMKLQIGSNSYGLYDGGTYPLINKVFITQEGLGDWKSGVGTDGHSASIFCSNNSAPPGTTGGDGNIGGAIGFGSRNAFGGYHTMYGRIGAKREGNFYGSLQFQTMYNLNDGRLRTCMELGNGTARFFGVTGTDFMSIAYDDTNSIGTIATNTGEMVLQSTEINLDAPRVGFGSNEDVFPWEAYIFKTAGINSGGDTNQAVKITGTLGNNFVVNPTSLGIYSDCKQTSLATDFNAISVECTVSGTPTNFNGMRIGNCLGSGTLTNQYGVFVDTLTKGSNNWGLYVSTNDCYIGGGLGIGPTIGATGPVSQVDIEGNCTIGASYAGTTAAPTNGLLVEGNVGISTSSPLTNLHIYNSDANETIATSIRLESIDGQADSQPTIDWWTAGGGTPVQTARISAKPGAGYTNPYFQIDVADSAKALQTRLVIDKNGDVGIGTTNPLSKLEVNGQISLPYAEADKIYLMGGNDGVFPRESLAKISHDSGWTFNMFAGCANALFPNSGQFTWSTSTSAVFTEKMRLVENGSLGIGTTSPVQTLCVNNTTTAVATDTSYAASFGDIANKKSVILGYDLTEDAGIIASIHSLVEWKPLYINPRGGNTILNGTTAGNVGIGTTTPKSKLDIEGNCTIGASYAGTTAAPTNGLLVEGNVGIGTTNPGEKLDVVGNSTFSGTMYAGNLVTSDSGFQINGATLDNNKELRWYDDGSLFVSGRIIYDYSGAGSFDIRTGNVNRMTVAGSGILMSVPVGVTGNVAPTIDSTFDCGTNSLRWLNVYTDNVVGTSDIRKKKNVEPLNRGIEFINKLRPVSYQFKRGETDLIHYGFIAQDIEVINEEEKVNFAGLDNVNPDHLGLRYTEFIAPLTKAVQEQQQQIDLQSKQIEQLTAMVQSLLINSKST